MHCGRQEDAYNSEDAHGGCRAESVHSPVCGCAVAESLSDTHGSLQCVFGDLCRHMLSSDSCFFIVSFDVAQAQALEIAPVLRGVRALVWRQEQPIRLTLLD